MGSLDVLDYLVRLDEALATRLPPGARKMARKEAKGVVEDLAFRFALFDDRVMPEEIDYARALEAVKRPEAAADVLARRAPIYKKRRIRKLSVTFVILALLGLLVAGFADFLQSEEATVLVDAWRTGGSEARTASESIEFVVPPGTTRVQFTATVVVFTDRDAARSSGITLVFLDPSGTARFEKAFTSENAVYAKSAFEAPPAGTWTVFVDYRDAAGTTEITVLGVKPR